VAIEPVIDHTIDVDACFAVVLLAIKFPGDADGLFVGVGDWNDAISHQKQHYVPYYLSIVFFLSLKYAFGIISMFFTLVRYSIILSRLYLPYLHPCFLPHV
jgi:hypothetical protein